MKKAILLLLIICYFTGCNNTEDEKRYSIKGYTGVVRYDKGDEFKLHLEFFSKDFSDYCEITLGKGVDAQQFISKAQGYGYPYTLENTELKSKIPLSYSLQWNQEQLAYDRLEGESDDGTIYATLTADDFVPISGTGTYTKRCQATTQKGTQCKRNAERGRSYCWQH